MFADRRSKLDAVAVAEVLFASPTIRGRNTASYTWTLLPYIDLSRRRRRVHGRRLPIMNCGAGCRPAKGYSELPRQSQCPIRYAPFPNRCRANLHSSRLRSCPGRNDAQREPKQVALWAGFPLRNRSSVKRGGASKSVSAWSMMEVQLSIRESGRHLSINGVEPEGTFFVINNGLRLRNFRRSPGHFLSFSYAWQIFCETDCLYCALVGRKFGTQPITLRCSVGTVLLLAVRSSPGASRPWRQAQRILR